MERPNLRVSNFHAEGIMPSCPSPVHNKLNCFLFCSEITKAILSISSLVLELSEGSKFHKITS